ncbi:MAG: putative DNA binding domain-containing protein [Tannerellaceae bacterium]|jgi:ATP-dependent DNA helicase RecG|nr:putative DNA binding domain-containing protein [Tannerellaceae bacterium]
MDTKSIRQIISGGENAFVGFSNCTTEITDSVFQAICSFLNKEGGTLVIGVHDFGKIIGVADSHLDNMLNKIRYTLEKEFSPAVLLSPEVTDIDGKKVISLSVPQCGDIQRYKNKVYDRLGREISDITYSYNLVENIHLRKKKESSENIVCPFLRMHEFEEGAFNTMRKYISASNPYHPWLDLTNEEILHTAGFWRKDPLSNKEGFVLAAVLLFGKEVTIQNYSPAIPRTDAVYRNINYRKFLQPSSDYPESKYDDRDIIFSNLIDSYIRLRMFIERNLPERVLELNGQQVDVREKIFMEMVSNMLVHREYTHKNPARLLIFSDRVITENGTRPLQSGNVTIDTLESRTKNPLITKVFQEIGWMGESGSGISNIRKYAPLYDRSYEAEIQNSEKFVLSVTYGTAEGLTQLEVPANNDHKKEFPLNGKTTEKEDIKHEWPILYESKLFQACPDIDISYVDKAESILEACIKPLPIQEMMQMVKQSNRTRFRQNIIRPLLDQGLLAMRIPTKPSSPLQKYFTTEKGKALL